MIKCFEKYTSNDVDYRVETLGPKKDVVYIYAERGDEHLGMVVIEFIKGGYEGFKTEMSEEKYDELFPNDRYAHIDKIEVNPIYRGLGLSRQLMRRALAYVKSENEKIVYLNANPYDDNNEGLDLDSLVRFYKSFGFEVFIDDYEESKEMILTLETVRGMESTQRTIDVFVKQFADEYNDKQKCKYEEEEEREDIIVDEYDEETPEIINKDSNTEPSRKHNSLGQGATNMP